MEQGVGNLTIESYTALKRAYDHFNHQLFRGQLPDVMIIYHRQRKVMGYAAIARWVNGKREYADELAVNPEYFAKFPLMEICQTLCHEMVHIWQAHYGHAGRRGYHNTEWAQKMTQIGLMPSATGRPGGAKLGEWMMDYVSYGGPFHRACQALIASGFTLPWVDRYPIFRHDIPVLAFDDRDRPIELDRRLNAKILGAATAALKSSQAIAKTSVALRDLPPPDASLFDNEESVPEAYAFKDNAGEEFFLPEEDRVRSFDSFREPNPLGVIVDEEEETLLRDLTSKPRPKSGRVKYVCKGCRTQLWGRPGLRISCDDCEQRLHEVI